MRGRTRQSTASRVLPRGPIFARAGSHGPTSWGPLKLTTIPPVAARAGTYTEGKNDSLSYRPANQALTVHKAGQRQVTSLLFCHLQQLRLSCQTYPGCAHGSCGCQARIVVDEHVRGWHGRIFHRVERGLEFGGREVGGPLDAHLDEVSHKRHHRIRNQCFWINVETAADAG